MRLFDGLEAIEVKRDKNVFSVFLDSTQVAKDSTVFIAEELSLNSKVLDGFSVGIDYTVSENARALSHVMGQIKTRLDRLRLAQKFYSLLDSGDSYKIPFLHPDNIMVQGEDVFVVHYGLASLVAPFAGSQEYLLNNYKALVVCLFNPKVSFEKVVSGALSFKDSFSQKISSFEDTTSLCRFIESELEAEAGKTNMTLSLVPKGRYRFYQILGIGALLVAIICGCFVYSFHNDTLKQDAIISSQSYFLTNNYLDALSVLDDYYPSQLPKSARYVLAASSINLTDLTTTQKQAVLNNISPKSDDNTLNYWIYIGRGDFNNALNLAQNLGDDQLTLLVYTDLYESTKLDTKMDGAVKQQLLSDYSKKIEDLSKALGQ